MPDVSRVSARASVTRERGLESAWPRHYLRAYELMKHAPTVCVWAHRPSEVDKTLWDVKVEDALQSAGDIVGKRSVVE